MWQDIGVITQTARRRKHRIDHLGIEAEAWAQDGKLKDGIGKCFAKVLFVRNLLLGFDVLRHR